jgi:hypothetical protein
MVGVVPTYEVEYDHVSLTSGEKPCFASVVGVLQDYPTRTGIAVQILKATFSDNFADNIQK